MPGITEDKMILAEKITLLRKRNGWSQEELAERLGVSRQSVSKWESAQSTPDLNRVLALSELFDVSTDVLLKDEAEVEVLPAVSGDAEISSFGYGPAAEDTEPLRSVSMAEANRFLQMKVIEAGRVAIGVMLCIFSPIALMLLAAAQESGMVVISEMQAAGIGILVLMLMVGTAVGIFVYYSMKMKPWEFIEKEALETEYGVAGMVRERQERYSGAHTRYMVTGIVLCVVSCVPIFISMIAGGGEFGTIVAVCLLLVMVGIGVMIIVRTSIVSEAMQALLEEGEFSRANKREERRNETIMGLYWMSATAIYLLISFLTGRWDMTWIVWPVAGVGCGILAAVLRVARSRE